MAPHFALSPYHCPWHRHSKRCPTLSTPPNNACDRPRYNASKSLKELHTAASAQHGASEGLQNASPGLCTDLVGGDCSTSGQGEERWSYANASCLLVTISTTSGGQGRALDAFGPCSSVDGNPRVLTRNPNAHVSCNQIMIDVERHLPFPTACCPSHA